MKTMCHILLFLLLAASRPCLAMMSIEQVSTNRAKALGVTFRTNQAGENGVQVWLEFKTVGELKNFSSVELQIGPTGKPMVSAPLLVSRPTAESVAVYFSADPAMLPTSVLTVVVSDGLRSHVGFRFQVKDFIGQEAVRKQAAPPVMPNYATTEEILAMPPVKATLTQVEPCSSLFTTGDRKQFVIGDPGSKPEVWQFLKTLKEGQAYEFPGAFLEHQKKARLPVPAP